ncbi:MAG TPA: hypothetical protein VFL72_02560 [Acidimicrobiia bacterium]|nr:hypothetical protein [Acidimicrobiia bacterium]
MIRSGRSPVVVERPTPFGEPVRLGADMWWVVATFPVGGIAFSYRRPRFVEVRGTRIAVHDYIWAARGFALVVLLMSVLTRRFIR